MLTYRILGSPFCLVLALCLELALGESLSLEGATKVRPVGSSDSGLHFPGCLCERAAYYYRVTHVRPVGSNGILSIFSGVHMSERLTLLA